MTAFRTLSASLVFTGMLNAGATPASGQSQAVDFDSDSWVIEQGAVIDRNGRRCFQGIGMLDGVELQDGTFEVDVWVDGGRSYPGFIFRRTSAGDMERFYVRPHKSGLYPDAQQYTPVFNGVSGWQLYSGPGYTAVTTDHLEGWVPLRMDVVGSQARVFVDGSPTPTLVIPRLGHGTSSGGLGLWGPTDGSACFADLTFDANAHPDLGPTPQPDSVAAGTVMAWEVSRVFKATNVNRRQYPRFYGIFGAGWEPVEAAPSGLVDIARHREPSEGGADLVLARTIIQSDRRQDVTLSLGYSDVVDLFFNGKKVFSANSGYTYRDPTFAGIIGYHDHLTLTLEKGLNEVFLMVTETFGGWGFMARLNGDAEVTAKTLDHGRATKLWETEAEFLTPETVVHDPVRNEIYVSSFDNNYQASAEKTGYLSRLSMSGEILEKQWITELDAPTGMDVRGDQLFVLERATLTEIDIPSGTVTARYDVPDGDFPNDLTIADDGAVYMTDTRPSDWVDSRIYRFKDGVVDVWLNTDEIVRTNGLFAHGNELIVGSSGDGILKAVDLTHKTVRDIVSLGAGVIDGIQVDARGNYLVSHWRGPLYVISPEGEVVEILDGWPSLQNSADFDYIAELEMVVIPTFVANRVVAYRINP